MKQRKSKGILSGSNVPLKPLPKKGWAILLCLGLLTYGVWWWYDRDEDNQWEYINKYGIKLPMKYKIHGIDISHHNAKVDWDRLKKSRSAKVGIDFVFIKATEGATHLDTQFERNWREAKRVGIKRGAYHFYNPRVMSSRQAENFIGQVRMDPDDLPPVLDLEVNGGKPDEIIIKGVKNWLEIVEAHYGKRPVIYVNEHYYKKYIAGNFDDYPLWLAGYSRTHLSDLTSDAHVLMWQHSEKGWVDGIRGFVDYNVFLHGPEDWERLSN